MGDFRTGPLCMIHVVLRGDQMILGICIGDLLPVSFSFFCFPLFSSPLMSPSTADVEVGGFTHCALILFFLHSSHLSFILVSFLGVNMLDPSAVGLRFYPNNLFIY